MNRACCSKVVKKARGAILFYLEEEHSQRREKGKWKYPQVCLCLGCVRNNEETGEAEGK